MHVDSRGTNDDGLPWGPQPPHRIFQLTGLAGPFVKRGVDVPIFMKKWAMISPGYGTWNLRWGGEVTVAQLIPMETIANNVNYLKRYMVEQIIDRDGDVVYKHEANPVRVYSPATATIMDLAGVIVWCNNDKSRISQDQPSAGRCRLDWKNRYH